MSPAPRELRILVACPACGRQQAAGPRRPGERIRCVCGRLLEVPRPRAGEAAVVRCASCGAPRAVGAAVCSFCQAPFAAGEAERNTTCPGCFARIPDRARFCPACGLRIEPAPASAGEATARACPACGEGRRLASRRFPGVDGAFLECPGCGGLWLARPLFERLERRAHQEATAADPGPRESAAGPPPPVAYRPCPECGKRMNRRNYAARSGVVLDVCARHGLWFDAGELEQVLDWIRSGRLDEARRRDAEEEHEQERRRRLRLSGGEPALPPPPEDHRPLWLELLGALVGHLTL